MAASAHFDLVQKIYIAFYQRPADPAGLKYWAEQIDLAGGSANAVITAFGSAPESIALYGNITVANIDNAIELIYQAAFSRPADAAGKAYWIEQFTNNGVTPSSIALAVVQGAQNADATAIANKLSVANEFTKQVDGRALTDAGFGTAPFNVTYNGDADAAAARVILKPVTGDAVTILTPGQITTQIKATIADPSDPINAGTFVLTTGTDSIVGTVANDVVNGSLNTLTPNDSIVDSSTTDNDTLNVELLGGSVVASTVVIKSIENLNFNVLSGTATVNADNFTGYKTIASTGTGTLTLSNLADKSAELIVKGNASLSATHVAAVVAGANDAVNVTLDAATGGTVTVGAGIETVNLTTKGGAATLSNFTAAAATVVIKGGQGFTLGTPAAGFATATTIDAREAGKASFTTSAAGAVAVLTGTADDTVVRTVDFAASDLFSLGGGNDTLVMTAVTDTAQATFAGVENVVFKAAASKIDMTKADQKAALTFEAGGVISAQGLAAGSTVASTKVAAGVVTVEFRDSVMGEATTLNLAKGGAVDAVTVKNVKNLTVDYGAAAVGAIALDSTAVGTEVTTDLTVNAKQGAALSAFALTTATELKNLTINAQAGVASVAAAAVGKLETLTVNNTSNAAAVTLSTVTATNAAGITSVKLDAAGGAITTGVVQNSGAIKEVTLAGGNKVTTALTSTAANVDKLVSTATGDTVITITNAGTADTTGTTVTLGNAALGKSNDLTIAGATKVNNTVTGGTGVDKITITDKGNNTINAGAGDDVISIAGGANTLTGGAGADTFTFAGGTGAATAAALAAKHTVITDFSGAAGQKDVIDFTAVITVGATGGGVVVGTTGLITDWGTNVAVTLADKITAAALTTGAAAGATVAFAHEGKSYLYVSGDVNTIVDAVDTVIELTGVALSSGFTINANNISAFA